MWVKRREKEREKIKLWGKTDNKNVCLSFFIMLNIFYCASNMLYQLVNKTLETRLLFLLKPICSIIYQNLSISFLSPHNTDVQQREGGTFFMQSSLFMLCYDEVMSKICTSFVAVFFFVRSAAVNRMLCRRGVGDGWKIFRILSSWWNISARTKRLESRWGYPWWDWWD